jgi:hypothetical protein
MVPLSDASPPQGRKAPGDENDTDPTKFGISEIASTPSAAGRTSQ